MIVIVIYSQQILYLAPGSVSPVAIIHSLICGGDDYGFMAELVATVVFMIGVGTVLQITFGIR